MEIGSREAIREAVIMGVGIGGVPRSSSSRTRTLRTVACQRRGDVHHAHVVCLEERREARLVKAFLDIVAGLQAERRGGASQEVGIAR
jgi:DNA-binding transcriptional LysR family regulator